VYNTKIFTELMPKNESSEFGRLLISRDW